MAYRAVTVTAYALIPADEYDLREGEIIDGLERALQGADAIYAGPHVIAGIPGDIADTLPPAVTDVSTATGG